MNRHKSRKSIVYSSQTIPAKVPLLSSNNKFNVEKMTGAQISDHMDTLSREEKMDFMSRLSGKQFNALNDAIYINAPSNRSPRNQALSHLSNKELDHYTQALYASHASKNNASGLRKRKRSTRHKKKRGKKTRKYRRKY